MASDGGIFAFGNAAFYGSMGGKPLNQAHRGHHVRRRTGGGYYEVASDGGIFAFGNAAFYGSMGGKPLNEPIVGIDLPPRQAAATGRWLRTAASSPSGTTLLRLDGRQAAQQAGGGGITGITDEGELSGYYEVASDGGIFAFGDRRLRRVDGRQPLNKPIVGIATTLTGGGYYEVASDGGIFTFRERHLPGIDGRQAAQPARRRHRHGHSRLVR